MQPVSILVLNYNGKAHLDACLSSLLRASEAYAGSCTVVRSVVPDWGSAVVVTGAVEHSASARRTVVP